MKSKHEIFNKFDYMKAYSYNLILTERTNSELEHEKNVGRIDNAFYRIFAWQIMGKKKERQLSQGESKESIRAKKQENLSSVGTGVAQERLQETRLHSEDEGNVVVQSRTDFGGGTPKRYVTTCYLKPKTLPSWYTESLLIFIGSTKRRYKEKVYFKHKLQPYYWSENMTTDVNHPPPKVHVSEVVVPAEKSDGVHYMSFEPQQSGVGSPMVPVS